MRRSILLFVLAATTPCKHETPDPPREAHRYRGHAAHSAERARPIRGSSDQGPAPTAVRNAAPSSIAKSVRDW